jgi:type II secretion system protein J
MSHLIPHYYHSPGRRQAFTLLELIVATAMVAIIALTLAASLGTAIKARELAENSVETGRTAALIMEHIRTDLQCALPPSRGTFAGSFQGSDSFDERGNEADDLVFFSTAPSPLHPEGGNGDIKQFELTLYQPENSNDHILVRRTINNLLPVAQEENPDEEVLGRNVYGFNVRYFDGSDWQDNWSSGQYNNSLPIAVEVTLSLEAPDKLPDGSPRIVRYTRVFHLPCYGLSNDKNASSSANDSSDSATPTPAPAPKGAGGAR